MPQGAHSRSYLQIILKLIMLKISPIKKENLLT